MTMDLSLLNRSIDPELSGRLRNGSFECGHWARLASSGGLMDLEEGKQKLDQNSLIEIYQRNKRWLRDPGCPDAAGTLELEVEVFCVASHWNRGRGRGGCCSRHGDGGRLGGWGRMGRHGSGGEGLGLRFGCGEGRKGG